MSSKKEVVRNQASQLELEVPDVRFDPARVRDMNSECFRTGVCAE